MRMWLKWDWVKGSATEILKRGGEELRGPLHRIQASSRGACLREPGSCIFRQVEDYGKFRLSIALPFILSTVIERVRESSSKPS